MEKDKLALLGIISCIEGELQNLKELESEIDFTKTKRVLFTNAPRGLFYMIFITVAKGSLKR